MNPRAFLLGGLAFLAFIVIGLLGFLAPKAVAALPVEARSKRRVFDPVAMLDAIAAVETDVRPWRVGPKGELGRTQFKHETWVRYTNAEFKLWASIDCDLTRRVERAHLDHLCKFLFAAGEDIDPALIAAAWHEGEHAARKHRNGSYAQRAANLYYDTLARREVTAKGKL